MLYDAIQQLFKFYFRGLINLLNASRVPRNLDHDELAQLYCPDRVKADPKPKIIRAAYRKTFLSGENPEIEQMLRDRKAIAASLVCITLIS